MEERAFRAVFLVGPTAVGKSGIAVELALRLQGEIISADSMQIYRGMDIGTAKPSLAERRGIPHHLLDILEIDQPFDVAQFRTLAHSIIVEINARGKLPIIVGGSGLYVRSLTQGLFEGPGKDVCLRRELETLDNNTLHQRLFKVDPAAASKIEANDRRRTIRALEVFLITQNPISTRQTQWKIQEKILPGEIYLIGINRLREELYQRCEMRVDSMFSQGFIEEVRQLLERGLLQSPTASKAIGYAEVIRYLKGEFTFEQTIKLIKQRTRNFAKRQLTWFRREFTIQWLEIAKNNTTSMVISQILKKLGARYKRVPL